MVQVNLIGKKRRQGLSRNWIVVSAICLFVLFVLYFLGASIYIVIRLYVVNSDIKKVDAESTEISRQISANKDALTKYVLSKYILDQMDSLKQGRFRYKDYLDQISRFMPANATLTNVDFATKGWVGASVSLQGVNALKEMENNLMNVNKLTQSEFKSVFSESVTLDRTGLYTGKLHFEIKANGGK